MIAVAAGHQRLLELWRERGQQRISLCHVDFHDDLRDLLIDRAARTARPLGRMRTRPLPPADDGSFLAHAVIEGRLRSVRWVHGRPGGRAWDLGIVRYRSDLFSWLRIVRAGRERAFEFDEIEQARFRGLWAGEQLSIDWDFAAARQMEPAGIGLRVRDLLGRLGPNVPPETFLCYSPAHCHPSLGAFRELAAELARRFGQELRFLEDLDSAGACAVPQPGPGLVQRAVLLLRRAGIVF
ncbi:MAG: hypothetical protein JXR96_28875 [Deltaproteobacteria bacterium]|nr:hypothetical protein [Deltaproteobacteria bacterium]